MTSETVVFVWLLFAFGVQLCVFFLELFDTAGGVNQFLLTGEKRVACGADFHSHIAHGASHLEPVATCAGHCTERVFRMNLSFHFFPLIQITQRFFKHVDAFQKNCLIGGVREPDVAL